MDQTIRTANIAVLLKLQVAEGVPAVPDPTIDALPVETDGIQYNNPWTMEASNEATGSLVGGAPLIVGQAATFTFKSRIKGAGAGVAYSPTVKPPLHQALQACGMRGQYTPGFDAVGSGAGTGQTAISLPSFVLTPRSYVGMPITVIDGVKGYTTTIADIFADQIAHLTDFLPAAQGQLFGSVLANWSYAGTSPSDPATRAADQPCATIYFYEDGVLRKFVDCRGVPTFDGKSARPGYGTFAMTGVYAGKVDTPLPANLAIAGHSAPTLVQGLAGLVPAVAMNLRPLNLSTWSLDPGSQLEVPDDPNTPYGFAGGQVVDRVPMLKVDPLATLVGNRDTITDIGNGVTMSAVLRHGSQAGNRWSLTVPLAQPVSDDPSSRGKLSAENLGLQCRTMGRDAYGRDTDRVLAFY